MLKLGRNVNPFVCPCYEISDCKMQLTALTLQLLFTEKYILSRIFGILYTVYAIRYTLNGIRYVYL